MTPKLLPSDFQDPPPPQPIPERSKCCGARAYVSSGDEGANFYVCAKCERACDIRCEVMSDLATPQDPPLSGAEYLNAKDRDALLDSQKQIDALADIVGGEEYGDCRECKEGTEHSHCDVCKNKLSSCSCPQRQPDGSWVEPTPPPEQLDERNDKCAFCRHIRIAHGTHGCSFYETCGCESFTPSTLLDTVTYVDSRTEEERANPPKTTLTTTEDTVGGEERCGKCKHSIERHGTYTCDICDCENWWREKGEPTPPSKPSEEKSECCNAALIKSSDGIHQYGVCYMCHKEYKLDSTPPKAEGVGEWDDFTVDTVNLKQTISTTIEILSHKDAAEQVWNDVCKALTSATREAVNASVKAAEERKDGEWRKYLYDVLIENVNSKKTAEARANKAVKIDETRMYERDAAECDGVILLLQRILPNKSLPPPPSN